MRMTTILHFILTVSEKCVTTSAVLLFGLFTAARDWPKPERPNTDTPERPNSERANRDSWGMIVLYCLLGLITAVVIVCFLYHLCLFTVFSKKQSPLRKVTAQQQVV